VINTVYGSSAPSSFLSLAPSALHDFTFDSEYVLSSLLGIPFRLSFQLSGLEIVIPASAVIFLVDRHSCSEEQRTVD